tara:strand:- start:414 stop:593 length:180 start_codon:yes stop_codon:yes gene_type:complete
VLVAPLVVVVTTMTEYKAAMVQILCSQVLHLLVAVVDTLEDKTPIQTKVITVALAVVAV